MSLVQIRRFLRENGPSTNRQIGEAIGEISTYVSRDMAKLIESGEAERVDGAKGRGTIAVYALKRQVT